MTVLGTIIAIISFINKLISLWEEFRGFQKTKRSADEEKKRQEREKGVDETVTGETDEDIFKGQEDVTKNLP